MAPISGSQSGGKILRPRRAASARNRTPYDRPPPSQPPQSPNWLSRFVISPTRFIASGAGKLFSSVLDLETSSTSSSSDTPSPSSSSAESSAGAEEVGDLNDENDNSFEGDAALNEGGTSELITFSVKELQPLVGIGSSKSKHTIEHLLMQESFSREEGDRLIKIIRSRVVDSPANDDGDKRPTDIPNMTLAIDSPELSSAAVMEAKKWLQEKKSRLDSNSDLGYGSHSMPLVALPQGPTDEGSPVDVAKSYMRARPPWASPTADHTKPPMLAGIQLFKEETPHLFGGNSTPSFKLKRDSSATGSWSIQDEIRRVRSRATEEMLRTLPSSKIDWSAFAGEHKSYVNSSAIEKLEASLGEKVHVTNLFDASSNLAGGLGSQVSPDLWTTMGKHWHESVLSDAANRNSEQNQGFEAVQQTKGSQEDCKEITTSGVRDGSSDAMHRNASLIKVNGINDSNEPNHQQDPVEETREALNSRSQDGNHLESKEKVGAKDALANGFPSSGPSAYPGQVTEQNLKTLNTQPSIVDSSQERTAQGVLGDETCVPDVSVNNTAALKDEGVASGSQNSSSVQYEIQQNSSQPGSEVLAATTPTSIAKQKGKRLTRYNRRDRSRGVK